MNVNVLERLKKTPILQGGMGAGVSWWKLARAVSTAGQAGIVSGTGLITILARRLQNGDLNELRGVQAYPDQEVAEKIIDLYYIKGGKPKDKRYKATPDVAENPSQLAISMLVVANFVEVYLAKEGHDGIVGINYLDEIAQHPWSIFGAMLAGVDFVIAGAGLPVQFPKMIEKAFDFCPIHYNIDVKGAKKSFALEFNPSAIMSHEMFTEHNKGKKPLFIAIVSTLLAARMVTDRCKIDGMVVELPSAGGHNASPRKSKDLTRDGQPIYHLRGNGKDNPQFPEIRKLCRTLQIPFWIAAGNCHPARLKWARRKGAAGVQIGTAFAFCNESGLDPELRLRTVELIRTGKYSVYTDPLCSPTGYPFKVAQVEETNSVAALSQERDQRRICDLRFLRKAYGHTETIRGEEVTVIDGWRCPSEPVDDYVKKGGGEKETVGKKCLCNFLMANIGHPQIRPDGYVEKPMLTSGDDTSFIRFVLASDKVDYFAQNVIDYVLGNA